MDPDKPALFMSIQAAKLEVTQNLRIASCSHCWSQVLHLCG